MIFLLGDGEGIGYVPVVDRPVALAEDETGARPAGEGRVCRLDLKVAGWGGRDHVCQRFIPHGGVDGYDLCPHVRCVAYVSQCSFVDAPKRPVDVSSDRRPVWI